MRSYRAVWMVLALFVAAAPASAQRFGVHANWSDDFDFGIGARVEVDAQGLFTDEEPFSRTFFLGSFDYFFPDCGSIDCDYWEINAGLAIPIIAADIDPYVGAGVNIANFSVDSELPDEFDYGISDTEFGLNLLGGIRFPLGGLSAFGEGRLELGGGEQLVLAFGVMVGGSR